MSDNQENAGEKKPANLPLAQTEDGSIVVWNANETSYAIVEKTREGELRTYIDRQISVSKEQKVEINGPDALDLYTGQNVGMQVKGKNGDYVVCLFGKPVQHDPEKYKFPKLMVGTCMTITRKEEPNNVLGYSYLANLDGKGMVNYKLFRNIGRDEAEGTILSASQGWQLMNDRKLVVRTGDGRTADIAVNFEPDEQKDNCMIVRTQLQVRGVRQGGGEFRASSESAGSAGQRRPRV